MSMMTATNRNFDYDASQVKHHDVQALHVLRSMHESQNNKAQQSGIADLLSMPAEDLIDFEPPRLNSLYQSVVC